MKNLKLLTLGLITFALTACAPTKEEALKYNDDLIAIEKLLSAKENSFIEAISEGKDATVINAAYEDLVKQSNEAIASAEKVTPFDNSTTYLDAAKEYFAMIKGITNNEYKQLANIAVKKQEEITAEDEAKIKELIDIIQDKSDAILNKIQSEQLIFATKYKFKVESDSTAKN